MLILSASQAETYDPEQPGGCPRRWWFERVDGRSSSAESASQRDGHAGHALFAQHLRGQPPPKRARMLKAVRGALHHLPTPLPPGRLIESRFDGQDPHAAVEQPDAGAPRRPLDTAKTLWLGGVPWDGYVDLRWCDGDTVTVWDHKFSSDIDTYAKAADRLIHTVQMPLYALDSARLWPEAERFRLVHLYVSRRGVHSFIREQTVSREQIQERGDGIAGLVARIQETARATSQEDVPSNRKACDAYGGCPHQSVCTAFRRKPVYELSEEEQALFGVVAEGTGAKPKDLDVISQDQAEADALAADGHTEEAKQILSEAPALAADGHYDGCPKGLKGQGCTCANRDALPDVSIPAPVASGPTPQVRTDAELLAADRAQPSTVGKLGANAAEQCATCPHPAHPGAQCTGKRGRGQCRCGVQAAAEREQDAPAPKTDHLPVCVQADGGKWLCMDGCTAGQVVGDPGPKPGTGIPLDAAEFGELPPVPSLQEGVRRHLAAQLTPPSPTPPEPRPALRLEIEFGPRAATILEKLAPALIELLKSKAGVL